MRSPFVFDVAALLRGNGIPENVQQSGPSPVRIGPEMIAIAEGENVVVEATLIPLGEGISVEADVSATLTGECVRCLRPLRPEGNMHVSEVFSASEDFISGEEGDGEDDLPEVKDDQIDLLQVVIDEAGLSLPFNPLCEELGYGECEDTDVPSPDGESGDEDPDRVDPRWSGLEKFL